MSYEQVVCTKVNCPVCNKPIDYYVNRRRFSSAMQMHELKLLRDSRYFSEKLVCRCPEYVEFFHNVIPNWRFKIEERKGLIDRAVDEFVSDAAAIAEVLDYDKR